jgi:phosphatidylglycerophosphatase A
VNSPLSPPKPPPPAEGAGPAPSRVPFLTALFGSALFSGYVPFASGTVGSAVGLAVYFIPGFEQPTWIIPVTAATLFFGIIASARMEKTLGHDPAQVTIDEVVGMWISLLLVPKSLPVALVAFVLFRIFDVVKPPPARIFDRLRGGAGIMLDDVVAGIYANVILRVLLAFGVLSSTGTLPGAQP